MGFCHNCGADAGWIDGNPLCPSCTHLKSENDRKRRERERQQEEVRREEARRKHQTPVTTASDTEKFSWPWFLLIGLPIYFYLSANTPIGTFPSAVAAFLAGGFFGNFWKQFFKVVFGIIALLVIGFIILLFLNN